MFFVVIHLLRLYKKFIELNDINCLRRNSHERNISFMNFYENYDNVNIISRKKR
jgi:hypothetical protein